VAAFNGPSFLHLSTLSTALGGTIFLCRRRRRPPSAGIALSVSRFVCALLRLPVRLMVMAGSSASA